MTAPSDTELATMLERCEQARYDHEHTCIAYDYKDGRCYHHETGEMCCYEPSCHDRNWEGQRHRLVSQEALLQDLPRVIHALLEANAIVRELAEGSNAETVSEDGDQACFFCAGQPKGYVDGEWQYELEHKADCLWLRARRYVEGRKEHPNA